MHGIPADHLPEGITAVVPFTECQTGAQQMSAGEPQKESEHKMKVLRKKVAVDLPKAERKIEEEPKKRKSGKNSLPVDEYKDEFEPMRLTVDDTMDLVVSVKRSGEMGLPHVDIRQYLHTEVYTGFTKKGVNIPIECLMDLEEMLEKARTICENKGLL